MAPTEQRDPAEVELREQRYKEGGPSQFWLSYCPSCQFRVTGRSKHAVLSHRAEHQAAFNH